jgi:sugar/nucleoside kinase (ribokinase family)
VDLVCERPASDLAHADSFVPRFGGATANVAVTAARRGARVALAGGAGDDAWGRWLRARLEAERVDLRWFGLVPGAPTPVAFVTADEDGEPRYEIYGESIEAVLEPLAARLDEAVEASEALFFGSNTLVGAREREITMAARERALALERPVIFDANLRLDRWRTHVDAAASANACVPGALLVRCNAAEARVMTGEPDPERAAGSLVKAGARMAVITLGQRGAILRGELRADALGEPVHVLSTSGAGDAFTAVLLARLAQTRFYPAAVAAGLAEAVGEAARACERWSAVG